MWELFKTADASDNATPTQVAQAMCQASTPGASRCTGAVPIIPSERAAAIAALNPKPDWEAWMPSEAHRIGSAVASE